MEATPDRFQRTALLVSALARLSADAAAEVLRSLHLGLSIGEAEARTPSGQAALLTAVNALSRSAGSVRLEVPAVPLVLRALPWTGSLDVVAHVLARWAGAQVVDRPAPTGVHVGVRSSGAYVLASGDAWTSSVDAPGTLSDSGAGTFGAVTAAHLAAARAFHIELATHLELPRVPRDPVVLSLWRRGIPPTIDRPEIGGFTLVGAGAVGQAALWALAMSAVRISGEVDIFDPQVLDASNLNRHFLAGAEDVGMAKADLAANFIRPFAEAVHSRVERFVAADRLADAIVSTVDNDESRYQIQGAFPRRLFHGATTGETVAAAVLDFTDGACLGCLFPRPERSEAQRISDETGIGVEQVARLLAENGKVTENLLVPIATRLGVGVHALSHLLGRSFREVYARDLCGRLPTVTAAGTPAPTIAYASGLAGALVAAELAKSGAARLESAMLRNYVQIVAHAPAGHWVVRREKEEDCPLMCASPALQEVVLRLWADSASGNSVPR